MVHNVRNRRVRVLGNICVILSAAVTALSMNLYGCITSKPKPVEIAPAYNPVEAINLHFNRPLIIRMPEKDPVTVEEHIRCGLFYFEQEKFQEAADEFEKATQTVTDPQNPLYRECLMSLATCNLITDNKAGFIKTVRKIKSSYTTYEITVIERRDRHVKAIFDLYDEFMKTGNY